MGNFLSMGIVAKEYISQELMVGPILPKSNDEKNSQII